MSAVNEQVELLKELIADPHVPTYEGIIAVGDVMTPELLTYAYERGVFPWPHENYPLLWFCPDERGVIDFHEFHMPRSFKKWLKFHEQHYKITFDESFSEVIFNCQQQKRKDQKGTWITEQIMENYNELHRTGHAYSVEVWREKKLVAGLYGVKSKHYRSCESMFHLEDNTSKLALYHVFKKFSSEGVHWVDIQMVTPVSESFGGKMISKTEFLQRIGF